MKVKKIAMTVSGLSLFSMLGMVHARQSDSASWCTSHNGRVETMVVQYELGGGIVNGLKKKFCNFKEKDGSTAFVGLEAYGSKRPSLAATMLLRLTMDKKKPLPTKPFGDPATNVCKKLGGSNVSYYVVEGGFTDHAGTAGICTFGDGSMIDAWSLIYTAIGFNANIKKTIRSKPLQIKIPDPQTER